MPKRVEAAETQEIVSPKKRKRIHSSPSIAGKSAPPVIVVDPYEAALTFEEKEAAARSTEKDMKLFHTICDTIRKIMSQIAELKKFPDKNRARISELRALAGLHVLSLKKINRLEKSRLRVAREGTHAAKQRVDTFHLTLQNLLYEIVHVRREVSRCLEFRSQDEDISLVSEEEFYRDAPEEISQPSVTQEDAHRRHLARLDWELEQRRRLAADCRRLEGDKRRIGRRISQQRTRLADLAPQLSAILQSTKPLQEELSLPLDQRREQHRLASLLPRPLYLLYVQTAAYGEACDSSISATICGNEEEALSLKQADQRDSGEESESDQEGEEEARRKKRHRKSGRDEGAARLRRLLHKHPLLVVVELVCKDVGRLVLEFVHLTQLGIVTVSVGIRDCAVTGALLSAESLLDHLEPGDSGADSPSAATEHRLRRAGLQPLRHYIAAGQLGKPYRWAQRLAGMEFVPGEQGPQPSPPDEHPLHVEATMRQIRARLKARVALQGQLTAIGSGDLALPPSISALLPARRESRLAAWQPVSAETFRASGVLSAEELDDSCSCYLARLDHVGGLQLSCYVALSPQHPLVAPVVGLKLSSRQAGRPALTASSPTLRTLECELNTSLPARLSALGGPVRSAVLPTLLVTAAAALDVLQRTSDGGPASHHRLTLRPHRGRDRVPPFRYNPTLHMFTHGSL